MENNLLIIENNDLETGTDSMHSFQNLRNKLISEIPLFKINNYISTTRFNNQERFSLEKLKYNKRKLEHLKSLQSNWNGYGAEKIDTNLILKVESIVSELDYQPQIFPTGRGTIQLEKYINEDNLVEIEISNDEIFVYQVKNGIETEKVIDENEINIIINELYA